MIIWFRLSFYVSITLAINKYFNGQIEIFPVPAELFTSIGSHTKILKSLTQPIMDLLSRAIKIPDV